MPEMADNIKFMIWLLLLCSCSSSCFGSDRDVQCLKAVQQSVVDPNGVLKSTWIFTDSMPGSGYICQFTGVECWHPDENRVLALRLSNLGLQGQFPEGLKNCTSLMGLDLSSNNFSGPIPSDISQLVPFLTSLDLSYNSFSGDIPVSISIMPYLNTINLQGNQFSGKIPWGFALLDRLTSFNVADNLISGFIPSGLSKFPVSSFTGNVELCGTPLDSCRSTSDGDYIVGIIGAGVRPSGSWSGLLCPSTSRTVSSVHGGSIPTLSAYMVIPSSRTTKLLKFACKLFFLLFSQIFFSYQIRICNNSINDMIFPCDADLV
jgi:hypothetical protein